MSFGVCCHACWDRVCAAAVSGVAVALEANVSSVTFIALLVIVVLVVFLFLVTLLVLVNIPLSFLFSSFFR